MIRVFVYYFFRTIVVYVWILAINIHRLVYGYANIVLLCMNDDIYSLFMYVKFMFS
jgi:hypothetical protein